MKKIKRYGLIAAAAVVLIVAAYFLFFRAAPAPALGKNLLINGDFQQVDGKGNPSGWFMDAWSGLSGADFDVVTEEDGNAAHIVNHIPKDARYAQEVSVEPDALYCLHGYIRSCAEGGKGANLSVKDVYVFSQEMYDTEGQWQEVTLYGRTGADQHAVTVYVRLGGYSGEATGEAFFRDISLFQVQSVPDGYSVPNWYKSSSSSKSEEEEGGTASTLLVASSIAYLALFVGLCHFLRKPKPAGLEKEKGVLASGWFAAALLLCAFALRLVLAFLIYGYNVDIGCFRSWAQKMVSAGPAGFYPADDPFSFSDYPPGYMWLLWVLGWVGQLLGTGVTSFMVKLPPIAADMALCAVLYVYGKKYLSSPAALAVSLLYAFNPLILATGAAWGQADAVMTLLLFLTVIFAVRGCWKAALPLYIAAVLCKPQALMFGPLGLAAFVLDIVRSLKSKEKAAAKIKDMALGLLFMAIAALAIALPFSIHLSPDWLFTLYSKTMGRYAYATVNACNFYFLMGKNWASSTGDLGGNFVLPLLVYLLAVLPLLFAEFKHMGKGMLDDKKERLRFSILGALVLALGLGLLMLRLCGALTYASLGTAMVIYCVALCIALYVLANDARNLPIFGAVLLLMLFNTGSMMHERYLVPAVALLLLGYILKKDTRILWLTVGVTVAGFLNVGCVLDRNIRIGGSAGHLSAPAFSLVSDMAVLEYFCAGLNCLACFAALWLCAVLSRGQVMEIQAEAPSASPLPQPFPTRKMTVRDWVLLCAVTAAYSVLAFTNLGATKAPQNAYVAAAPDEQIVLDLGDTYEFQMLFYGGIHQYQSDFTVEISGDGHSFTQSYSAPMPVGDCFKWKYLNTDGTYPITLNGRYVRITSDHYGLTLFEVLFKDAASGNVLPAQVVSDFMSAEVQVIDPATGEPLLDGRTGQPIRHREMVNANNETAYALVDEPDSMAGDYPSWYNSMYFDEIYHARTAYEHLHQMQPYEYTHPPLGKVMMSWFIGIFGMTPFGWRFAGALAGVLMLPGMYLLGKLLIKRSWGGLGASLLLALDLMHFTQTRIATIDSFVVLFIIWMVYFMLRWVFLDFFHTSFWETLVPLALSGLCMGLAVASKWTGCYAGVALALIFFYGVWRRSRVVLAAGKIPQEERTEEEKSAANAGKRLLITVASCLIFFVLVPLAVYYCSYIPFYAYDGVGVSVKKIIAETQRMFDYHSTPRLGMDHSFYSPWYEWPVIAKPMWYSSNAFEPTGYQMSITAMGNPVIWWGGLLCIVVIAGIWLRRHLQKDGTFSFSVRTDDPRYAILLLCYFVQLLPWILVPRGTYIYHYFPCVPFLVLAILLSLDTLADRGAKTAGGAESAAALQQKSRWPAAVLLGIILLLALLLFIAFFPYASGVLTRQSWMDSVKWFSRWLWY